MLMYWVFLLISFLFSIVSFLGAGFALIAAAGVLVLRVFLSFRIAYWKVALLIVAPILGQSLGAAAFAYGFL